MRRLKHKGVLDGVSIPSMRVGDIDDADVQFLLSHGFHPLKAGRRRERLHREVGEETVSIPSRRVGDLCDHRSGRHEIKGFPSPQGGSETSPSFARSLG